MTSTGPGEGKTLVASNLAIALAQAGQRVLLVDADMRKPRVHEHLRRARRSPGCRTSWSATRRPSEAVQKTSVAGLWVLPAGLHPPNPAELLGSPSGSRTSSPSLTQHFDWVILDTPPVMAVTDASLVAHLGPGVLFVSARR